MRETLKSLHSIIDKLTVENKKIKGEKTAWEALSLLMIAIVSIYAIVNGVIWIRDVAVPKTIKSFSSWYNESEFNRGFWGGTVNAGLFIGLILGVKFIFSKGYQRAFIGGY